MNAAIDSTISVKELEVFFGDIQLLGPLSFSLGASETLIIMGETGAGKSLVAQAILGTLPKELHFTGEVEINGRQVQSLSTRERAALWGHEIAALPQEPWLALDPLMHSQKQVIVTHRHVAGRSLVVAKKAAEKDFSKLGLVGAEKYLPSKLSGGMAQRVAFAAATAGDAPILLADEPTKGLDHKRVGKLVELLKSVPKEGGTLIAITHDIATAKQFEAKILVLKNGKVVESGIAQDVLNAPQSDYTSSLLDSSPVNWKKQKKLQIGVRLLKASDVSIERGGKTLIQGFDLEIYQGERVAITGPSGVGKTSLLDVFAGLLKPKGGVVEHSHVLRRNSIQKLYQDPPTAFPPFVLLETALKDVVNLCHASWDDILENMDKLMLDKALLKRYPNQVSGGELQRISIVRALITKPQILLCDEPTSRLDPITQHETLDMLAKISSEKNIGLVLVTHDEMIARKWAHRNISL